MKTKNKTLLSFLAATVLLAGAMFTGCSQAPAPTDDPASPTGDLTKDMAFEVFTKVGTSEALNGDVQTAETVVMVADLILEGINTGELSTPELVDDAIADLIAATNLEPASKASIYQVVSALKSQYATRIDLGQLDPTITAPVATIVEWVREAALDTIRFGSVQTYGAPPLPRAEMGATETALLAKFLGYVFVEWWRSKKEPEPVEDAAYLSKPLDESLYGWLTSKRTRDRYPLAWENPQHVKVDPKFHEGLKHMLANPQPLPDGI